MMIVIAIALLASTQTDVLSSTVPPKTASVKSAEKRKAEKLICEKQEMTGSRLAQHSICLTEADWRTARNQARVDVERAQNTGINGH